MMGNTESYHASLKPEYLIVISNLCMHSTLNKYTKI